MKLAYYIKKRALRNDERIGKVLKQLRDGGIEVYDVFDAGGVLMPGTDVLLSFGGDGTFLSAARAAVPAGVAMIGVNLGRLGFLSENAPEDVAKCDRDIVAGLKPFVDSLPSYIKSSASRK